MKNLFAEKDVAVYLEEKRYELRRAIDEFPEKHLVELDLDTLVAQFFNSAVATTDVLKKEKAVKEVIGSGVRYTVPFKGKPEYFGLIPRSHPHETAKVTDVTQNELVIDVEAGEGERNPILTQQLALIEKWMTELDRELTEYNASLPDLIRDWVVRRKEKVG